MVDLQMNAVKASLAAVRTCNRTCERWILWYWQHSLDSHQIQHMDNLDHGSLMVPWCLWERVQLTWWGSPGVVCWSFFFWWARTCWVDWAAPGLQSSFWSWRHRCFLELLPYSLSLSLFLSLFPHPPCGSHWEPPNPTHTPSSHPNRGHVTLPRGSVSWYHNSVSVII